MSDPKYLDLAFSQAQDNMGMANMSHSKNLNLIIHQIQGNVGLANMSDSKNFLSFKIKIYRF
jgi:hypothetical protein